MEIPGKTKDWISPCELRKMKEFSKKTTKYLNEKFAEFQSKYPQDVRYFNSKTGQKILCLKYTALDTFAELYNLKKLPLKTSDWYSITELIEQGLVPTKNREKILQNMKLLQSKMPNYIQRMRFTKNNLTLYCLHKEGIEDFLRHADFSSHSTKGDEWYSPYDLKNLESFPIRQPKTIQKLLEKLQKIMPEYIQERKPNRGRGGLCLHRDGITKFLELSGLNYQIKDEDMVSASDLQFYPGFPKNTPKINKLLEELQPIMPNDIQRRRPKSNGHVVYYLRRSAIGRFKELSGLEKYPFVTPGWLSPQQLCDTKFIIRDAMKLHTIFTELIQKYPTANIVKRLKVRCGFLSTLYLNQMVADEARKIFNENNNMHPIECLYLAAENIASENKKISQYARALLEKMHKGR